MNDRENALTLSVIALVIDKKLDSFARLEYNSRAATPRFYYPAAWRSGNRCCVSYERHRPVFYLSRREAARYLAWLNEGNMGTHFDMPRRFSVDNSLAPTYPKRGRKGVADG